MPRPWMPKIAGILDIVIGGMAAAFALVLLVGGIMTWGRPGGGNFFVLIATIFAIIGVPPIIGGIYALRRKRWQLALICSLFAAPLWGIGIVAAVFVALSKKEFT